MTRSLVSARLVLAAALAGSIAAAAHAQVTPDRLYFGIGRSVPMTVAVPAGVKGDAVLQIIEPVSGVLVESAAAAPGAVNLAEKFPTLWTTSAPRVLYLQLVVGDTPTGAPVVLQPLVSPDYAARVDGAGNPQWQRGRKIYSGLRAYTDKHVVLETSKGQVQLAMRPDMAPNTVFTFRGLVEGGYYTDILFHRIADLNGDTSIDILQVGDPSAANLETAGQGGPGFNFDLEPSTLQHDLGVISMARTPDPNTNGSQVFLCLNRPGTGFLDGKYTSFGTTVKGADVLKTLSTVATDPKNSRPIDPPMIKSATLVDAPPMTAVPKPEVKPEPKADAKPAAPATPSTPPAER